MSNTAFRAILRHQLSAITPEINQKVPRPAFHLRAGSLTYVVFVFIGTDICQILSPYLIIQISGAVQIVTSESH